jgi:hypothetical protein
MTTNKKFAGFDLDDVFAQEEARLKKEREEQERRRQKQPSAKQGAEKKPRIVTQQRGVVPATGVLYEGLEFEERAPREGDVKKTFYYDTSLSRLRRKGYERHPLPAEAFSLIIDGLEGKLSGGLARVHEDMLESYGEWLSMVFARKGNTLHCYEHPENLRWNNKSKVYSTSKMAFLNEQTFDIATLPSETWISIKDVEKITPGLVTYLWSRPLAQLPDTIQKKAGLYLPADGVAWPVGRGNVVVFDNGYDVGGYYDVRASRGVRSVQKNSTGNKGSP